MSTEITENLGSVDWRKCFYALLRGVMRGGGTGMSMHSSEDLSAWVQSVHDHGDPRVARELLSILSTTRPKWVQDLMG